jgi:hypothetical protein
MTNEKISRLEKPVVNNAVVQVLQSRPTLHHMRLDRHPAPPDQPIPPARDRLELPREGAVGEEDRLHVGLDVIWHQPDSPTQDEHTITVIALRVVVPLVDDLVLMLLVSTYIPPWSEPTLSVTAQPSFGTMYIGAIRSVALKCHRSGMVSCVYTAKLPSDLAAASKRACR